MVRLLTSLAIMVAANTIGLAAAALILPTFRVDTSGFIVAAALLSVVEVLGTPLLTKIAISYIPALRGSFALVVTFIGVGLLAFLLDSVSFPNLRTWILATLVIWLAALVATLLLPMIVGRLARQRTR